MGLQRRFPTFITNHIPAVVFLGLGAVAWEAVSGIIGNRADAFLSPLLQSLWSTVIATASSSFWLTGSVVGIVFIGMGFLVWRLHSAQQVLTQRLEIEDSFIRLLSTLDLKANHDDSLRKLVTAYLESIAEFLRNRGIEECATIVYRPEHQAATPTLITWTKDSRATSKETERTYSFATDASDREKGIVGKTFLDGDKVQIATVREEKQNRRWIIQNSSGQIIQCLSYSPGYASKAAIPIQNDSGDNIGVLCIYCRDLDSFQRPGIVSFLPGFADRLAIAIQISIKNRQLRAAP